MALCEVLAIEAFSLYYNVMEKLILSDVEKGNHLMLT